MLPSKWKLVVRNNTGGPATINKVAVIPWKFDSNGAVEYGGEIDVTGEIGTVGDGAFSASDEKDNSAAAAKYFGFKGLIKGTGGTQDGALEVYIEWPDASGEYPSAQTDANVPQDCIQLAALTVGSGGRATNFSYE